MRWLLKDPWRPRTCPSQSARRLTSSLFMPSLHLYGSMIETGFTFNCKKCKVREAMHFKGEGGMQDRLAHSHITVVQRSHANLSNFPEKKSKTKFTSVFHRLMEALGGVGWSRNTFSHHNWDEISQPRMAAKEDGSVYCRLHVPGLSLCVVGSKPKGRCSAMELQLQLVGILTTVLDFVCEVCNEWYSRRQKKYADFWLQKMNDACFLFTHSFNLFLAWLKHTIQDAQVNCNVLFSSLIRAITVIHI